MPEEQESEAKAQEMAKEPDWEVEAMLGLCEAIVGWVKLVEVSLSKRSTRETVLRRVQIVKSRAQWLEEDVKAFYGGPRLS